MHDDERNFRGYSLVSRSAVFLLSINIFSIGCFNNNTLQIDRGDAERGIRGLYKSLLPLNFIKVIRKFYRHVAGISS